MAFSGSSLFLRLSLLWVGTCSVTIHYTSPGKALQDPAGVFKVVLDIDTLVDDHSAYVHESIVEHQFVCAKVGSKNYSRLSNIKSLSYDSPALRTYIQLDDGDDASSTAVYGNTCDPDPDCSSLDTLKQVVNKIRTTDKGLINSLTSFDDTLYFVYTPEGRSTVYFGYRPYLEIRQVRDGYNFPAQITDSLDVGLEVNIDVFSTLLIRITPDENRRWLQAGSTLRVLPAEGSGLVLVTVVRAALYPDPPRNNTLEQFSYALVAARVGGESEDEAVVLHVSQDTWTGWYNYKLDSEGGVSYNEGTLCWTAADTIRCSTWSPEQPLTPPTDVVTVLKAGEASEVFQGPLGQEVYANVTTGVVIAESPTVTGRLVLFFGCLATYEGTGGFGMLVRQYSDGGETVVMGVSDKAGPLLSGAMVIVPDNLQCDAPATSRAPTPTSGKSGKSAKSPSSPTSGSSQLAVMSVEGLLLMLGCLCFISESYQILLRR